MFMHAKADVQADVSAGDDREKLLLQAPLHPRLFHFFGWEVEWEPSMRSPITRFASFINRLAYLFLVLVLGIP